MGSAPVTANEAGTEYVDVLVVGAGLSGIGAACHLRSDCPDKTIAVLEARAVSGGTWDLFRYPGIRSDSDMHTMGYAFRPWREDKSFADGPSILRYVRETARQHGVDQLIRFQRRVVAASWCSATAEWTVDVAHTDTGEASQLRCTFLYCNTGYYRYDEGYTPQFAGRGRFSGPVVHPQHWPEDLDVTGKRVIVIGSGATAVTLVPALTAAADHVVMVQRSPTYIAALPALDPVAQLLRRRLPARLAFPIVRWKNILLQIGFFQLSRHSPDFAARLLRSGAAKQLPDGFDVDTHFRPSYRPWDQRLCVAPNGDLFQAISNGRASVVTDRIEMFTERGLRLGSGEELDADIIVTATGLNLQLLGGMSLTVDGRPVELPKTVGYKGMMLSGVPNLAITMGYTNASWTLKGDLAATYVCRLLNHMRSTGTRRCTPRDPGPSLPRQPFIDLSSGYVARSLDALPKQGTRPPWRLYQNYLRDVVMLKYGKIADPVLEFART